MNHKGHEVHKGFLREEKKKWYKEIERVLRLLLF